LTPSDALNRSNGYHCKLIHVDTFKDYLNPAVQDIVIPADILTVQRNLVTAEIFDAIQYWQGMGKPIAIDLDDAYHILPWSNPAHKFWIERENSDALNLLEHGLSICDGLIAPNRLLLSDWAHVTRGYYLQNFAEKTWWENLPTRKSLKKKRNWNKKIVIGWGGSVSHYDSWMGSGAMEAAEQIAKEYSNVLWMICGNDDRIFKFLPVPKRQKFMQPGVPPNEWPTIIKHFDIGVAPLFGPYDQRRSWIKGLEYLLAGVPWVATQGEPYKDLAQFGTLIENSPDIWYDTLRNKINNLEQEHAIAEKRAEIASQWLADNQIATFDKVFREIIRDAKEEKGILPEVHYVRN